MVQIVADRPGRDGTRISVSFVSFILFFYFYPFSFSIYTSPNPINYFIKKNFNFLKSSQSENVKIVKLHAIGNMGRPPGCGRYS